MQDVDLIVAGVGACFPMSQKRDIHPTDEDLSVGTPDMGRPCLVAWLRWELSWLGCGGCIPTLRAVRLRDGWEPGVSWMNREFQNRRG